MKLYDKHGQYYAVYRDPIPDPITGKRKQIWDPLGKNQRIARVRLNEVETLLEQGQSPRRERISFSEAWSKKVAAATVSESTKYKRASLYKRHLEPYFGSKPVKSLNSKQVFTEFTIYCRSKGMKDTTLRNVQIDLKAFMNWCWASDYLLVRPQKDWIEIPKSHPRQQRPLTFKQVEELANAIDSHYKVFVLFSSYVGSRLGETRAIKWEDFSDGMTEVWIRRAWTAKVLKDYTKTDGTRHTPIMPRLREALEELRLSQGSPRKGFVFTDKSGNPVDGDIYRQRYHNKATKLVELDTYTIHDLRHTACSLLHKAGATPREIMEWLGWANMDTLLRYLHNYDEENDIAQRMQERWEETNKVHTEDTRAESSAA